MSRVGLQGSDSLVFIVCREPQRGEAPRLRLQEDALEYILEVGSDYGAQAAGLLLALCHWRACQQQALRDPRSILVGEW